MYYEIIIGVLVVFIILLLYLLRRYHQKMLVKEKEQKSFYKSCSNGLLHLPIMSFIVDTKGIIKWHNHECSRILADGLYLSGNIEKYIPDLGLLFVGGSGLRESDNHNIIINGRIYTSIISNIREFGNNYEILVCLLDDTNKHQLEVKLDSISSVIGFIQVDNYSEVVDNLSEDEKVKVILELDRIMFDWSLSMESYLKKYSDNRYLIIMNQEGLRKCQSNSFEILDKIRNIDPGVSMPLTLSIGLGRSNKSIIELTRLANAGMEMAISRGGDQAVVKLEDETIYYNGKAAAVAKKTKVLARGVADAIKKYFEHADNIMFMGHIYADVDSAASAIGLASLAKTVNDNVCVALDHPTGLDNLFEILKNDSESKIGIFITSKDIMSRVNDKTLLVICDTNKPGLVREPLALDKAGQVIVIDHHIRSEEMIQNVTLSYIEPGSSSTCELITEIIQYFGNVTKLDSVVVSAILSGIVLDTKNFTSRTGARTYEAAGYLHRLGAEQGLVRRILHDDYDTVNYRNSVIQSAVEVSPGISVGVFEEKVPQTMIVAAQAADELLDDGNRASFVLYNLDNSVRISGRSDGSINVQKILEQLGGGGHFNMAAAQLANTSMDDARNLLIETIDKYISVDEKR